MGDTFTQFIGRFYHALEQKGRLSIPKSFRSSLHNGAILTRGLDGCLFLYPKETWAKITAAALDLPIMQKNSRDWVRLLSNHASEAALDNLGRLLIPDYLRQLAKLQKEVVVVGSLSRIEIWDQAIYHTYMHSLDENAENIAENLGVKTL